MKILFLLILKLFLSCTSNPFWNDPETEQLTLSGTIFSENNTMGTPISVWLETFENYSIQRTQTVLISIEYRFPL